MNNCLQKFQIILLNLYRESGIIYTEQRRAERHKEPQKERNKMREYIATVTYVPLNYEPSKGDRFTSQRTTISKDLAKELANRAGFTLSNLATRSAKIVDRHEERGMKVTTYISTHDC